MPSEASLQSGASGELRLAGVLDLHSGAALREDGRRLIAAARDRELVLDCSGVIRSSSVGLALLLAWLRDAQAAGKSLQIRALPEEMRKIAEVSELEALLPLQA